jgi:hypothetical protein
MSWGDRHKADPTGPAVELEHRDCGALVHPHLRCEAGHDVDVRQVRPRPGPGARRRAA